MVKWTLNSVRYRVQLLLAVIITFLSYNIHYFKRKLFYQSHCLEENSKLWLSFLEAHPDPATIYSDKRGLLFVNDDCISLLTPQEGI